MTQVATLIGELEARWTALIEARPNEVFDGFKDLPPSAMTESIRHLGVVINALEAKSLFTSSPELATAAPALSTRLARASGAVNDAMGNNLGWLGQQTHFFEDMAFVQATIGALTTKRISLARDIAKDLGKKGLPELERVIEAGDAATVVLDAKKHVEATVASMGAASAKATEAIDAIQSVTVAANSSIAEIRRLEGESKASAQAAIDAAARIEGTGRAIAQLKEDADARETALEAHVKDARAQVTALVEAAQAAKQEVRDALRLARDQGLAMSFQSRSSTLKWERVGWTAIFLIAVGALAYFAVAFASAIEHLRYEEFVIALVKRIALAAPCVWLGWYAARQVGRVARVQEDYEYKAASALAYQSYKDEAALGADPSLITSLLRHAIDTFGENPVRLYADGATDPVTPLEALFKNLPKEEALALATALVGAAERLKKG